VTDSRPSAIGLRLTWARALALGLVVCACAPSASAQRPRPDRPYRGLFGGNGLNPNSAQQLDVSLSLSGGYDDNVLAEQGQYVDPRFQQSGGYGSGSVSLDYTKKAGQADFEFSGGTAYRYYPSVEEMTGFNSWGSVGFTVKLGSRTTLGGSESVSYSPFYAFGPFPGLSPSQPGQIVPTNPDYPLLEQAAWFLYSSAAIEHRLTPRSSLWADYNFTSTKYTVQSLAYRSWSAGGRYSYRLNSQASLRLGYHFRRARAGPYYGNRPVDGHDIDAGVDYTKALSISRKTTFGFNIGPSVYRSFPAGSTEAPQDLQYQTHYLVNANAYLNRQIGRSWNARLTYVRGVEYVQGFADPFLSDTVTAGVGGFVDQRSRFNASSGYTRGNVGFGTSGGTYDTYFAGVNYQFALTQWLAAYADYGYYHYLFDYGVPLPPGLNPGQDRQSVHVGVNLWAPLLR
jgi:hypothetical protein